ncbi:hypothetical protein AX17_003323 [Amanita inopinata Kibby_2008]|nr:hypothetical protein AX17_003323 [Amanita inopinata Kibby_2008]
MPRCIRNGCRKDFADGDSGLCIHHPGAPVFHEGLKSWSCCANVNKPVLSFDEFMTIPGCTETDQHSEDAPQPEAQKSQVSANITSIESKSGAEVYTIGHHKIDQISQIPSTPPPAIAEEEDDPTILVVPGTICKHRGCAVVFISDEVNRLGDGEGTVCTYHPRPPIFREGSKGYLCCKRRVLEFEEFLKIPGCKTGRHLFAPKPKESVVRVEQTASCRIDHYQTPSEVHVSVFGKQADKERSTVKFEQNSVLLDLYFPGMKRFQRVLDLFGPIDPVNSSFQILNTKVELHLRKQGAHSWTLLEKATGDLGNIRLTFGVGGRTGTVGAKEVILDDVNKSQVFQ